MRRRTEFSADASARLRGNQDVGDAVGGVVADAVMLVKDWEYATPRGSFSKLERGDIEARDLIEYYAISREHSRNRITATT